MAAALTLVSATPYGLKYQWIHDGAGSGTATVTKTQMLADLVAVGAHSPLRDLLEATIDNIAWGVLPNGGLLSLATLITAIVVGTNLSARFGIGPLSMVVAGVDANAGNGLVEIRFHHTYDR